ncbi:MAG TPA: TIGR03619 family F420-dependent LLM class oxidoreductase [Acidimicrobiia bacterium]|nr:TIGR03619 family F420-dependent LLM class oxidoreductase [Acidimicrobiia bacterium]
MSDDIVSVVPAGKLVFGIQLPSVALSTMVAAPWERENGAGVPELVRAAQAADHAGFFYVAVCDHVAIPRQLAPAMSTTWYEPISTLGFLAGHTTRAHLMTNVFVGPYRHPLQTAKAFSTLDTLSDGRVILGMGAGHVEKEFEAMGLPFAERGRMLDDAVDGVKEAWQAEFTGSGDEAVGMRPRPVQRPRPPIWIGGSSRRALRRVAERGDGWIPQGTPRKKMPESIAYLRAHCDQVRPGAAPEIGVITEAMYVGEPGWEVARGTITGPPEKLAESMNEYGAMGVCHLQVRFQSRSIDELCDQVERFGAEVGPHLTR